MIFNLLSGVELNNLYKNDKDYEQLNSYLPESPLHSLNLITTHYGVSPSISGHNIEGIMRLRNALYELDSSGKFAAALMIVAPHTHWNGSNPIIIEKTQEKYLIGQKKPESELKYIPVSFITKENRILAYEWAAPSTNLDKMEIIECIEAVEYIFASSRISSSLFGISINFRFKDLFKQADFETIENPIDFQIDGYNEVSVIEKVRSKPRIDSISQQVSWNMYSDLEYNLTAIESEILNHLRTISPEK